MDRVFVGVLRLVLLIPGARSLKDRRQAVVSLRDRITHRFPVSAHEVDTADRATRQILVVTTAGNDATVIRSNLDRIAALAASSPQLQLTSVDVDVFRWQTPGDPAVPLSPASLPPDSE